MKPLLILILSLGFTISAFGQEINTPDSIQTKKLSAIQNDVSHYLLLKPVNLVDTAYLKKLGVNNEFVNGVKEGIWIKYHLESDRKIHGFDLLFYKAGKIVYSSSCDAIF